MQELAAGTLTDTLLLMSHHRMSGAIRAEGDAHSGTLFLSEGRLSYGSLVGEDSLPGSLEATGIDPELWLPAIASPIAERSLGDALITVGAEEATVREFARWAVATTIEHLMENTQMRFSISGRRHPFGERFCFDVETWTGEFEPPEKSDLEEGDLIDVRVA